MAKYKRKKIGIIPESWKVMPLSDIADSKVRWSFTGGPFGSNLKSSDYVTRGVRIIQLQNIGDGKFKNDYEIFTSKEKADELISCNIYPGEIILSKMGDPVARACIIPPLHDRYLMCSDGIRLAVDKDNFDPYFIFTQINAESFRNRAANAGTGSTRKRIGLTELRSLELVCPTIREQQAIAAALRDIDALLDSLNAIISKKRGLKEATMQQLLTGRVRLPGFDGEWENKRLGDLISHCFSGGTPRRNRPEFYKGDVRWITSGELNYNVITDTIEKISNQAVTETNLTIHPVGTFLMAITGLEAEGPRGSCGIVGAPAATNQSCMAVFPLREKLIVEYLFHYYVFCGKSLALKYCQGTKQQSYTAGLVKKLPISLPSGVDEQAAIATVLSDMDKELLGLVVRRDKTMALKKGMMQELLTGKTRLI